MIFYVVCVNGKISGQGYKTLTEAQNFCKSRSDNPEMVGNGWCFMSNENVYTITDIKV
jgi:hypothetical protein